MIWKYLGSYHHGDRGRIFTVNKNNLVKLATSSSNLGHRIVYFFPLAGRDHPPSFLLDFNLSQITRQNSGFGTVAAE